MRSIIIYYSNSGTTRKLADKINKEFPGNMVEVVPKVPYGGYLAAVKRAGMERKTHSIAEYTAPQLDLDGVDTIFVGYPIWYSHMPTFLADYLKHFDFSGKRVVPFSTSGAGGIKSTLDDVREAVKGAKVQHPYSASKIYKDNFEEWVKRVKA